MPNKKEVDQWLWSIGIGGVTAVALIMSFGQIDDQGRRAMVIPLENGCLAFGNAVPDMKTCDDLKPLLAAATPKQNRAEVVQQQNQNSHEIAPIGDSVRARIEAKQIGEQFEVVDRWKNRYLVEKTGRDRLKVISILEQSSASVAAPVTVPIRHIREVN